MPRGPAVSEGVERRGDHPMLPREMLSVAGQRCYAIVKVVTNGVLFSEVAERYGTLHRGCDLARDPAKVSAS
jgi:hypothetical protein